MTWEFIYPGTWVIFGIVAVPVYAALLAWFLGKPRTLKTSVMGVGYFVSFIASLWIGFFIVTQLIRFVFPAAM